LNSPADRSASSPPAPLLRRLAATVYESLLLGAIVLLLGLALLPLLTPGATAVELPSHRIPSLAERALSFAAIVLVCGAYCVWLWSSGRKTLPMKTWRLALETADGAAVGVGRAIARYAAWWIGPALAVAAAGIVLRRFDHASWALPLLAVNYAWALLDPDRRFLHDRIASTRLVAETGRTRG
jgi:uncharacterized RDD family membrane protein YckC